MSALHWHDDETRAWLRCQSTGEWSGWHDSDATHITRQAFMPFGDVIDAREPPLLRWFCGGRTNAAFNELDRQCIANGRDIAEVGCIEEHADAAPPVCVRRLDILIESVMAATALHQYMRMYADGVGLVRPLVCLFLPNRTVSAVMAAAAKRLGLPYVPVASGTSAWALADRVRDSGAAICVTSCALRPTAEEAIALLEMSPPQLLEVEDLLARARAQPSGQDVLAARAMAADGAIPPRWMPALWRFAPPEPVESSHPLFVLYTSGSTGKPKGIVHVHGGYLVGLCRSADLVLGLSLERPERGRSADARQGGDGSSETLLVVATPGWITGQSYMLSAAMLTRTPSLLLEGSPLSPPKRIATLISRHAVTVIKAGSTFLRVLMTLGDAEEPFSAFDLTSLRLGIFCAEPVNEAVHKFAVAHLTPNFINAYWATEHGAMVWSQLWRPHRKVVPDARAWPLPWTSADVMVAAHDGGHVSWRRAADGEAGDVIMRSRPPHMALTVWQSVGFGTAGWSGDRERFNGYFVSGPTVAHASIPSPEASSEGHPAELLYVQGDVATRHTDGAYSFYGRSDEVINVGGNRIGTAEIESVLLAERGQTIANAVVVGAPHPLLGSTPVAFVVLQPGAVLETSEHDRLRSAVSTRLGSAAAPIWLAAVSALPETYSGKYMRRTLTKLLVHGGGDVGDLAALRNPQCLPELRVAARYLNSPMLDRSRLGLPLPLGPLLSAANPTASELRVLVGRAVGSTVGLDVPATGTAHDESTPETNQSLMTLECRRATDSLSLFAATASSTRAQSNPQAVVVGYMYFFVLLQTLLFHYAKWLPPKTVFPQQLLRASPRLHLTVALMLVGRADAAGGLSGRAYWKRTVFPPAVLLAGAYAALCFLPKALCPDAPWSGTRDVTTLDACGTAVLLGVRTYYTMWFFASVLLFKAMNGLFYDLGLSRRDVALLSLAVELIPRHWLEPVAPIWHPGRLMDLAAARGLCDVSKYDFRRPLPMMAAFFCPGLGFQSKRFHVIDVRWSFYCIGPFILHGDAMSPVFLKSGMLRLMTRMLLIAWAIFALYITCAESDLLSERASWSWNSRCLASFARSEALTQKCCSHLIHAFSGQMSASRGIWLLSLHHPRHLFLTLLSTALLGRLALARLGGTILGRQHLVWVLAMVVCALPLISTFDVDWIDAEAPPRHNTTLPRQWKVLEGASTWISLAKEDGLSAPALTAWFRRLAWYTFQVVTCVCWAAAVPRTPSAISDGGGRPVLCYLMHHWVQWGPIVSGAGQVMRWAESTWPVVLPTAWYFSVSVSSELFFMLLLPRALGHLLRAVGMISDREHGRAAAGEEETRSTWRARLQQARLPMVVAMASLAFACVALVTLPSILGYHDVVAALRLHSSKARFAVLGNVSKTPGVARGRHFVCPVRSKPYML